MTHPKKELEHPDYFPLCPVTGVTRNETLASWNLVEATEHKNPLPEPLDLGAKVVN